MPRKAKEVDPLPRLLEAARRALREHLTRAPFSHPDIEFGSREHVERYHVGARRRPPQTNQGPRS